jgi:hypothetical protein
VKISSIIRGIGKTYFEFKFESGSGETVHILEKPEYLLDEIEQKSLREEIFALSLKCTPNNQALDYGIFNDPNHNNILNQCILTLIRDNNSNKLIAFNCLPLLDLTLKNKPIYFVHLGLVMIDPDYRSKGLLYILYGLTVVIMFCRKRLAPIWVSNVTQVPAVVGSFSEGFNNVFPNALKNSRRSFDHLSLVRQIMLNHTHVFGVGNDAEFDEKTFIIKNAYTGGSDNLLKTWNQVTKYRNDSVNDFCQKHLNYDRGDDFIQIGKFDFFALQKYIIRMIPAKSLILILNNIFIVFLQSILLPVYHWFKADTSTIYLKSRA